MQCLNQQVQRIRGSAFSVRPPAQNIREMLSPKDNQPRLGAHSGLGCRPVAGSSFPVPYWPIPGRISHYCPAVSPAPTITRADTRRIPPNPAAQSLLTRLRGRGTPEAVQWPVTRSNRATAGSGTEFGGLLGAAGAAAAAAGAFGECPGPCSRLGLRQQLCGWLPGPSARAVVSPSTPRSYSRPCAARPLFYVWVNRRLH